MNRRKSGLLFLFLMIFTLILPLGKIWADGDSPPDPASPKVKAIKAIYTKQGVKDDEGFILVGTALALSDFDVTMVYEDGKEAKIPSEELQKKCKLLTEKIPESSSAIFEAQIEYIEKDKVSDAKIIGKVSLQTTNKKLKNIKVTWNGKTKYHVGDSILLKEISAEGIYELIDRQGHKSESKRNIASSEVKLEPDTIKADGENSIKATYKGFEVYFNIRGYASKGLKIEYSGPKSIVVGQHLDKKKLKVSQLFSSGELKKIDDYQISDTEIKFPGANIITITYAGATEQLTITGVEKKPEKITAKYEGSDLTVGKQIDISKVILTVTYNDKSTDTVSTGFTLNPTKVNTVGVNTINVDYKGLKTTISIKANEMAPGNLVAVYNGGMVIEGSQIKKSEISVTAYFPDGTTKVVSDFELSTETMNTIGMQEVVITYKGAKASIYVPVTAKMVTSLSVSYKGAALVQYASINRNEIVVTATYNDGSTQNVSDYTMTNTVATTVGRNVFTIFYGGKTKDLVVEVLPRLITGRGTLNATVSGENFGTTLTAFIENQSVREGIKLETEIVENKDIKKAVRRVQKTDKYLAFELTIDGFQFDENKYLITEATLPEGFNPATVGIYYTPNRETVMVQQTGGLVSPDVYRFYAYRPGTYVIMEKDEPDVGRQELREEGERTPFLIASLPRKMKVKEKRGIKPFLLFAPFKNEDYTYESSDEDVLMVSKEGLITAKAEGEASITVSSVIGGYSKTYEVSVSK